MRDPPWGAIITPVLKGLHKEDRNSFFIRSYRKKTRLTDTSCTETGFIFLLIFFFFSVGTVIQWNDLPRDMVESESMEVFEMRLKSPVKSVPGQCYRIVSLGEKVLKGKAK